MSVVGVYGAELQLKPADPCLTGLGALACLDTHQWLAKLEAEARRRTLAAQNIASRRQDTYVITHVHDPQRALDLFLAGFDQLSESEIEQWLNVASALGSSQAIADPQLQEAWRLLRAIDSAKLVEWLQRLAEAKQQGNFDEAYNQLLSQGIDQLQRAYMLLLRTENPGVAKELIKQMALMIDPLVGIAQQQSAGIEFIKSLIIWLLTEAQPTLPGFGGMSETEAREIAEHFATSLQVALGVLDPLLQELCGMGFDCGILGIGPTGGGRFYFIQMVAFIIGNIWTHNSPFDPNPFDGICSDACQVLKQLDSFLAWIGGLVTVPTVIDPVQRRDIGFGTFLVVYFSTQNLQKEYNFGVQGFLGPTGQPLSPNDPRAFFITEGKIDGKRVIAVVRGDHCSVCDFSHNVTDIVQFVHGAIDIIASNKLPSGKGDYNVVVLVFTRSGAQGVQNTIDQLKQDPFIMNSDVPVMVITRSGSTIYYKCVNSACENLPEKIKKVLACVLAGRKCESTDQVKEGIASSPSSSPYSTVQAPHPATVVAVPPSKLKGIIDEFEEPQDPRGPRIP